MDKQKLQEVTRQVASWCEEAKADVLFVVCGKGSESGSKPEEEQHVYASVHRAKDDHHFLDMLTYLLNQWQEDAHFARKLRGLQKEIFEHTKRGPAPSLFVDGEPVDTVEELEEALKPKFKCRCPGTDPNCPRCRVMAFVEKRRANEITEKELWERMVEFTPEDLVNAFEMQFKGGESGWVEEYNAVRMELLRRMGGGRR